jgi:small subunit ribosomal protein S2
MKPYIFGKRNLIHIIDVKETLKGILLAKKFLSQVVAGGKDVLLVGTKRQARKAVEEHAKAVNMHHVTDRWLGGSMTNFREIRKRVGRLDQLEQLEADGMLDTYSKKEGASLRREIRKIRRNLGGIRKMDRLPGAIVVIDQRREINAVREARKMGIPVICLLDTDSDPDLVDIPIPGNDDAMRAIELVVAELCEGISAGLGTRQKVAEEAEQPGGPRRRSRRATARAGEAVAAEAAPDRQGDEAAGPAEEAPASPPAPPPTDAPQV